MFAKFSVPFVRFAPAVASTEMPRCAKSVKMLLYKLGDA